MAKIKSFLRWCGFHIHAWSDWKDEGELYIKDRHIGRVQIRRCTQCNYAQSHRIWFAL